MMAAQCLHLPSAAYIVIAASSKYCEWLCKAPLATQHALDIPSSQITMALLVPSLSLVLIMHNKSIHLVATEQLLSQVIRRARMHVTYLLNITPRLCAHTTQLPIDSARY
ncbi:hypothetical protein GOP47_0000889 [Adiantum capillus-veneris]|uniref:Uncharacterized protein n=1 Tax=Adiantum capillus-veneris TaxID=13818 RepID=A0A9D4VDU5_ADICA|nr:hypothetical protein GOP47_0000889 [Adiantum capillus-veneris]